MKKYIEIYNRYRESQYDNRIDPAKLDQWRFYYLKDLIADGYEYLNHYTIYHFYYFVFNEIRIKADEMIIFKDMYDEQFIYEKAQNDNVGIIEYNNECYGFNIGQVEIQEINHNYVVDMDITDRNILDLYRNNISDVMIYKVDDMGLIFIYCYIDGYRGQDQNTYLDYKHEIYLFESEENKDYFVKNIIGDRSKFNEDQELHYNFSYNYNYQDYYFDVLQNGFNIMTTLRDSKYIEKDHYYDQNYQIDNLIHEEVYELLTNKFFFEYTAKAKEQFEKQSVDFQDMLYLYCKEGIYSREGWRYKDFKDCVIKWLNNVEDVIIEIYNHLDINFQEDKALKVRELFQDAHFEYLGFLNMDDKSEIELFNMIRQMYKMRQNLDQDYDYDDDDSDNEEEYREYEEEDFDKLVDIFYEKYAVFNKDWKPPLDGQFKMIERYEKQMKFIVKHRINKLNADYNEEELKYLEPLLDKYYYNNYKNKNKKEILIDLLVLIGYKYTKIKDYDEQYSEYYTHFEWEIDCEKCINAIKPEQLTCAKEVRLLQLEELEGLYCTASRDCIITQLRNMIEFNYKDIFLVNKNIYGCTQSHPYYMRQCDYCIDNGGICRFVDYEGSNYNYKKKYRMIVT